MNLFNEPSWLKAGGLFSEPDIASLRESANRDAMMQMAMGLLAQSGYSTKPQTLGEGLASGVLAGQKAHRQAYRDALADKLTETKLITLETQNKLKPIRAGILESKVTPGQFGYNLSTDDPVAKQLAAENLAMAEKPEQIDSVLQNLQESASYNAPKGAETGFVAPQATMQINRENLNRYRALATDEQFNAMLQGLKAQQELFRNKPVGEPLKAVDGQGNPVFVQRYEDGSQRVLGGFTPPADLTNDQKNYAAGKDDPAFLEFLKNKSKGQVINVYPEGAVAPGKKGQDAADEGIDSMGAQRVKLERVFSGFETDFLTIPTQIAMSWSNLKERSGLKLDSQTADKLTRFSRFSSDAMAALNAYINAVTGAAIGSGEEEARIRSAFPDPQKDGPTQFMSKLQAKLQEAALFQARYHYIKTKGYKVGTPEFKQALLNVNVDKDIPRLMREETKRQISNIPNFDPKNSDMVRAVEQKVARVFGLL